MTTGSTYKGYTRVWTLLDGRDPIALQPCMKYPMQDNEGRLRSGVVLHYTALCC